MRDSLEIQETTEFKNTRGILEKSLKFIRERCTKRGAFDANRLDAVSYTHLTLPTIYSV